jgi:hypothetical protein
MRTSVTAVGATEFDPDEAEESASTFSGGGFSNLFRHPKYQNTAVQGYLRATNNTHNICSTYPAQPVRYLLESMLIFWI